MAQRFPKELPVARLSRTRRLAQVVVKLKDISGAMADITSITAAEGVDIRQSVAFAVDREGYAVYSMFVWLKLDGYKLEHLVGKLKKSPYVLDVQAKDGVEGAIVDTLTFPIRFAGERAVLLQTSALVEMFEEVERVFGSGGSVIVHQLGVNYGKAISSEMAKTLTRPYMIRNYRYGLNLFSAMGWGIPQVLNANEDLTRVTVRIDDCFECRGRPPGKPEGWFTGGFLAGVFSFLSGKEVRPKETKCTATGDDHCEFQLS